MNYSTKQRNELLAFFQSNPDKRITAKQIAFELKNVSLSAIYRNLSRLANEGALQKFASKKGGEAEFQFVKTKTCANEVHLTCTTCGSTFHMQNKALCNFEQNLQESSGFVLNKSKTVVYGTCKKCTSKTLLQKKEIK